MISIHLGSISKVSTVQESHSSRLDGKKPSAQIMTEFLKKIIHACTLRLSIDDLKTVGHYN